MFKHYLKDKTKLLIWPLLIILIFNINLFVYNVHLEIILYSDCLTLIIVIMLTIYDYIKYKKKAELLKDIKDNILYLKDIEDSYIDELYISIIKKLNKQILEIEKDYNLSRNELIDYYTLWIHQIKTPIAAMRLILEKEENIDLSMELLKIEQYTNYVLTYIRLNSDCNDFVFKESDLDKIVKDAIKSLSIIFINKKIRLEYQELNYKLITDEKWFTFMIEQVLSNSLKYTKNGGCIKIYVEDNNLVIEDNGCGISEEELPRIFDKTYSGSTGRNDKKATGIGLYLVKTISDKINHKVKISSKVDVGTKFYFDILNNKQLFD